MRISVGQNLSNFIPVDVTDIDQLADLITKGDYAPSVFANGHRINKNFLSADVLALDFDGGLSLSEAITKFAEYKCIIGTTKSHQKEKNGIVSDRFRVILWPDAPINDIGVFKATMYKLMNLYPNADKQCKDPARMFYKCHEIVHINHTGLTITPSIPSVKEVKTKTVDTGTKGSLSKKTLNFMVFGASPGTWNASLFKAAIDCHEQGYDIEETIEMLQQATRLELGNDGEFDDTDIRTIESAFEKDPDHDKRIEKKAFNFRTIADLYEKRPEIDWLVDGLLSKGGISVIAGPPKAGKSTLIRGLTRAVAKGEKFLDRQTKAGGVVYLALEEQQEMLYSQFTKIGVTKDDPILFHVGSPQLMNYDEEFEEMVMDTRPALIVLDTLVKFASIVDHNNYKEVYGAISKYCDLARKSNSHIVCIHHTNKSQLGGVYSMMGSTAFAGAVDTVMYFSVQGKERYLTTDQRGGTCFYEHELIFNNETQSYTLGESNNDGF